MYKGVSGPWACKVFHNIKKGKSEISNRITENESAIKKHKSPILKLSQQP